jgi:hypothetical protein
MTRLKFSLGLTCLSVGVFACDGEPERIEISSQQAALTAGDNTERALQSVIDAADFLASSTSIAATLHAFGGGAQTCEGMGSSCPAGVDCLAPETCTSDELSDGDLEETRQEIRENAADLVKQLRERFLIEANLESETSTSATYRLGPDVLCSSDDEPAVLDNAATGDEADEDCAERVERLEPRLVLTSPREGDIDVALSLGAERHVPLSLALYRQSLSVRFDLGEAFELADELGEDVENVQKLSGLLELRLVEHSARNYGLELNVLEALDVVVSSKGETVSASLGASSPAWSVQVDGDTNTLSASLGVAAFRLLGPLRVFASAFESDDAGERGSLGVLGLPGNDSAEQKAPRQYTGVIDLFLAGLTGKVSYTADSDILAFEDLGFGSSTSTLKHDGNTLFGLDLNATQGRRVNLTISPTDDGAHIAITPTFDLSLTFALHYVANQFDNIADALLDNTFRVWFDGAAPALEVGDEQLRVASGTLHIDSQANPSDNVSIEAGLCLAGEAEANVDASSSGDEASSDQASSDESVSGETSSLFSVHATTCE